MSGKGTPILFTLYDPETGDIKAEYSTFIVPFGVFEVAIEMSTDIDLKHLKKGDVKTLAAFVVALFGNRFEVDDVMKFSEGDEMMAVYESVMARMDKRKGNPTSPG